MPIKPGSPSYSRASTPVVGDGMNYNDSRPKTAYAVRNESNQDEIARPRTSGGARNNGSDNIANALAHTGAGSTGRLVDPKMPYTLPFTAKVPKFIQDEKKVLRFYAHFLEDKVLDRDGPLAKRVLESKVARHLTIYYYIEDDTIEATEVKVANSGMFIKVFFRILIVDFSIHLVT